MFWWRITKNSAMTLLFDLETWFKVIASPLSTSVYVQYEPNLIKGKELMVWRNIFHRNLLLYLILKIYSRTLHTLYPKTIVGKVRPRFGKRGYNMVLTRILHTGSTTTLSFDFKTWFNEQSIIHKVVSFCMFCCFYGINNETYLRLKKFLNGCTSPRSDD